jgi:hypothetical protein
MKLQCITVYCLMSVKWSTLIVVLVRVWCQSFSAAIHTAHNQPDEYPPRTEEGDDAMEEMVGTIILHIRCGVHLREEERGTERREGGRRGGRGEKGEGEGGRRGGKERREGEEGRGRRGGKGGGEKGGGKGGGEKEEGRKRGGRGREEEKKWRGREIQ